MFLAKVQRYSSAVRTLRAHHRSGVQFNLDACNRVRRIADLFIGCGLLGLTGPLMLLVVIALKFESHSAVLERQNCIAAGGRRFQMLKFRTRRDPDRAPSGFNSARRVPPPDTHRSTADAHQCAARRRKHHRPKPTVAIVSRLTVFGARRRGRTLAVARSDPKHIHEGTRSDTCMNRSTFTN